MSVRRYIVVAVLGVLLVSGCGNDDDKSAGRPGAQGPQARAEEAVLTLADLPAGWKVQWVQDRPDHVARRRAQGRLDGFLQGLPRREVGFDHR